MLLVTWNLLNRSIFTKFELHSWLHKKRDPFRMGTRIDTRKVPKCVRGRKKIQHKNDIFHFIDFILSIFDIYPHEYVNLSYHRGATIA